MTFRILTPTLHGVLDYVAAAGLIVLPFLLDLGAHSPLAARLSVIAGIGLVAYSLATDYAFGVFGLVPFRVHLMLDLAAAIAFVAAPFVFGWSGIVLGYYLFMAAGVLAVVGLSHREEADGRDLPAARQPAGVD